MEEASVAGFLEGETVDVEDLMYGLVLPSGADAAEALAIMVAGSNEEFAKLMNEKCQELGLKYTHFTNPTGLYDEEQYTTPSEMAMIMEYAMKDETRAKYLEHISIRLKQQHSIRKEYSLQVQCIQEYMVMKHQEYLLLEERLDTLMKQEVVL